MAATEGEPQVAVEPTKDGNPPPKSAKTKKATGAKAVKSKKVPAPRKRGPAAHPPYFQMIEDAIATLKEKTGSSQYAITKFIEDKQKNLPPNFRKLLLVQLKKQVSQGKLVKVKSSYKLPSAHLSKPAAASVPAKKKLAPKAKPKSKTSAAAKEKKSVASKAKTVAAKAKPAEKGKPDAKPKVATKRKAPEKAKSEKKPAVKVAKTATRSTPSRKAAVARKSPAVKKVAPSKKSAAVKKLKTVKKVAGNKGKKK